MKSKKNNTKTTNRNSKNFSKSSIKIEFYLSINEINEILKKQRSKLIIVVVLVVAITVLALLDPRVAELFAKTLDMIETISPILNLMSYLLGVRKAISAS